MAETFSEGPRPLQRSHIYYSDDENSLPYSAFKDHLSTILKMCICLNELENLWIDKTVIDWYNQTMKLTYAYAVCSSAVE